MSEAEHSSASANATRGRKYRRTRTGCLTCRARKIKCDESVGNCANCSRADLECVRSGNERLPQVVRAELAASALDSEQLTQAGLERRRIKRSCATCKLAKKRCGGERPYCVRCLRRGRSCDYRGELEPAQTRTAGVLDEGGIRTPGSADEALADKTLVRELCGAFFEEIAPLRCFGFIHRHTFIQDMEDGLLSDDTLLLSVCALGTKTIRRSGLWDFGCAWARTVQKTLFENIEDITVRKLMCIVLLHEHAARVGELRLCFMLSGMASRYTQALSLNLEYDYDILCSNSLMSPVEKESRRRLMWACYILDTLVACGLNHLQVIDTSTIQVQLPCDERHFLYKVACRTAGGPAYSTRLDGQETAMSSENQGIDAFLLRLYLIRERILRYINSHADEEDPWRLTLSLGDLEHWKESLPAELQFNSNVVAIREQESTLSPLVSLHVQYHQVNCLLYRCTIPSMLFPAREETGLSTKASASFLSESRKGWFDHACAMSTIFEVALDHRPLSMTDPAVAPSAYNAIIIKWLYLTNFVPHEERLLEMQKIMALAKIDLQFLRSLQEYHPSVATTATAAEKLVTEASIRITQDPTITLSETNNITSSTGLPSGCISPDHRMNPLSTFAQMRMTLPELHAPSRSSASASHEDLSPGGSVRLWIWR